MTTIDQQGYWYLASYPKSGNTWCRVFITELQRLAALQVPEQLNLNHDIQTGAIASSRHWLDDQLGINSCDLSFAELVPYVGGLVKVHCFMQKENASTKYTMPLCLLIPRDALLLIRKDAMAQCISFAIQRMLWFPSVIFSHGSLSGVWNLCLILMQPWFLRSGMVEIRSDSTWVAGTNMSALGWIKSKSQCCRFAMRICLLKGWRPLRLWPSF